jgi:hypothetical protein
VCEHLGLEKLAHLVNKNMICRLELSLIRSMQRQIYFVACMKLYLYICIKK